MDATLELNVEAFDAALKHKDWTDVQAARELGIARSTIYRLRKKEMGMSGGFVATLLATMARPNQPSERLFAKFFIVTPTKE